jgi:enoyl-CoA hydratase/carnithine racemase
MLFESPHVRVTAEHGTATLWLGFPGEPANALDLARLRELDAALGAAAACRFVNVLVVRSALPAGFCAGLRAQSLASLTDPADRAAFAWYGQEVFDRLARLDAVSVALIDGPCLGVGLELALACDHRVCVARPTTRLGFPDRLACFGGTARLRHLAGRQANDLLTSGRLLSGREAKALGLVDVACCERRAKIELRTFLDRLERRPVKPLFPTEPTDLAAERRAFAATQWHRVAETPSRPGAVNPVPPFPEVIGLLGNDANAEHLAAEAVLRGGSVVVCGNRSGVFAGIARARSRGFVTRLEAEEAWRRVRSSDTLAGFEKAGLVFAAEGQNPFRLAAAVRPRTVVCVVRPAGTGPLEAPPGPPVPFPFSRRLVRVSFCERNRVALFPGTATDADTTAALVAWLRPFDLESVVFPVAARLLPRAA